jgi:hypothetical protein
VKTFITLLHKYGWLFPLLLMGMTMIAVAVTPSAFTVTLFVVCLANAYVWTEKPRTPE